MRHISFHIRFYFLFFVALNYISDAHAARMSNSYFKMNETVSENLTPFPKWTGVISRFADQEQVPESDCGKVRYHPCSISQWRAMLEKVRNYPLQSKLAAINNWSNAHPYVEDQLNWGIVDYWETPFEFMEVNGDCEDYAISKYYSLRAAGIPAEQMRVMVVQDFNLGGIIHAILGVYDGDELWILDNQIKQVRSAYSIYHYRPIYGVNEEHWWRYQPNN